MSIVRIEHPHMSTENSTRTGIRNRELNLDSSVLFSTALRKAARSKPINILNHPLWLIFNANFRSFLLFSTNPTHKNDSLENLKSKLREEYPRLKKVKILIS